MEQITIYVDRFLAFFNIDSAFMVFGNSVGAYVLAFTFFLLGILIFALTQYFVLSCLDSVSKRNKTDLDDAFVKMVRSFSPPFYLFISFWFSLRFISIYGIADNIVTAILVVWMVYQVVIIIGILIEDIVFRHLVADADETTKSALHLLANLAKGVMWVLGILMILSNFGIDVTSLIAGAGIAGIAIAFALQGILSDLFSSFSIYFDKPFKVGDYIKTGDTAGVVKQIGVKSTRIQSLEGEEVVLSNQGLTSAKIQNYKQLEERRATFSFGVLYETSIKKLRFIPEMVQEIVEKSENVRFGRAHFKSFGESSLDFEVVYYVLDSDYLVFMDIQQEINLNVFELFEKEGIGFAYPTHTVYMVNDK